MDEKTQQEGVAGASPEQDFRSIKNDLRDNTAPSRSQQGADAEDYDKKFADLATSTERLAEAGGKEKSASGNAGHARPRIGSSALYRLSADDAEAVNRRRDQSNTHREQHVATANGTMIHVGNKVAEGDAFPMLIVRTWDNLPNVNGQVFLDGNDHLWVQSVREGDGAGEFSFG